MLTQLASLAVLGSLVAAAPSTIQPIKRDSGVYANCRSFNADVYAQTSQNVDLKSVIGGPPPNQQVLVESSIQQFAAGSTVMQQIMNATKIPVNGTYNLFFEYCEPKNGNISGIFQTHHGLVGNAGYWNVQLDNSPNNSFAESAAAAGWATLSYDRLGVGRSAKPDGTNIVQISYEAAQSVSIAQALRAGNLSDVGKFNKIVGVGHSYGSNLLTGVASLAPKAFDALVLTGFTNNATQGPLGLAAFQSTIASVAYPARFASDANDYVITPSVSVDQTGFFHYPNYTNGSLEFFTNNKGEYTLGQQNTIAAPLQLKNNYTSPVLVVTGEYDAPYCAANCYVTSSSSSSSSNSTAPMTSMNGTMAGNSSSSSSRPSQLDTAKALYPSSSNFQTYVVPDTAHGINYHTTAYGAYQRIIQFVKSANV
ncbi:hypothetical protein I302_102171 [Kwoniella bestiolae CBS 10118]|uniref:AB hydrolase-1 domain-containing protein n=1 Tax=Kwoniella bestiolae CBS 10118 TaxID=1296100 RepID=A0A1B9GEA3_9TREE|nr:hypothetical protein I302_00858 [Kwoniella bestiolae CBS 10118]OCF29356.1 hypothetical protein I302_00858 [Kwoniella bestiolae CBS 10118]